MLFPNCIYLFDGPRRRVINKRPWNIAPWCFILIFYNVSKTICESINEEQSSNTETVDILLAIN